MNKKSTVADTAQRVSLSIPNGLAATLDRARLDARTITGIHVDRNALVVAALERTELAKLALELAKAKATS